MLGLPASIPSSLPRRTVGRTRLQVSELGLGAASLGNLYRPMSGTEAQRTLAAAFDAGIGYVDCAPYYGFGLCEQRVGEGLRGREDIVVSTKVGRLMSPHRGPFESRRFAGGLPFRQRFDYRHDGAMRSIEHSLLRLGTDRIDVYYMHRFDDATDPEETWRAVVVCLAGWVVYVTLLIVLPQACGLIAQ